MKQKLNFLEDLHPVIVKLTPDSIKTYHDVDSTIVPLGPEQLAVFVETTNSIEPVKFGYFFP